MPIFERLKWQCKKCEDDFETIENYKLKSKVNHNNSKRLEAKLKMTNDLHMQEMEAADKIIDKLNEKITILEEQLLMKNGHNSGEKGDNKERNAHLPKNKKEENRNKVEKEQTDKTEKIEHTNRENKKRTQEHRY